MTHRPISDATNRMVAAATEHVQAEAMATADPVMGDVIRRDAKLAVAQAVIPLDATECAALGVPAQQVVRDGALTLRLQDTSYAPSSVEAHAHKQRLQLAIEAGCGDLAMDAAVTIQATSSLERMIAHQLAAAHAHAMRLLASADRWLQDSDASARSDWPDRAQRASVEAARLTSAAARMMAAYQDGVAALARMRTGGQQTVTVQHVHVGDGGQAVVAGSVRAG